MNPLSKAQLNFTKELPENHASHKYRKVPLTIVGQDVMYDIRVDVYHDTFVCVCAYVVCVYQRLSLTVVGQDIMYYTHSHTHTHTHTSSQRRLTCYS